MVCPGRSEAEGMHQTRRRIERQVNALCVLTEQALPKLNNPVPALWGWSTDWPRTRDDGPVLGVIIHFSGRGNSTGVP